jgi:hypothetical protein
MRHGLRCESVIEASNIFFALLMLDIMCGASVLTAEALEVKRQEQSEKKRRVEELIVESLEVCRHHQEGLEECASVV